MKTRSILLVLLSAVVLLPSCKGGAESFKAKLEAEKNALLHRNREVAPVQVKVVTVTPATGSSGVNYVGHVEASKSSMILSPVPGTAVSVTVKNGSRVRRGDVLARISSESVQSAYDVAKATLDQAQDGYDRVRKVYESGSVSEVKMVDISTQLEKAEAAFRSAKKALEDCTVTAPFSGVVSEVFVNQGENVGFAASMMRIVNVESVEIHMSVPEKEYAKIAVGTTASVEIPALEKTVTAVVTVKGVNASSLSHAYDFTLGDISDAASLMPGMVCKVFVNYSGRENIVIPASSVLTDMEGRYVWAVDSLDAVCKKRVVIDGFEGQGVVVSQGLKSGDKVIVQGSRKVSGGMKVKTVE